MKISVVIPTYSRPDLLDRLLNSISSQTRLPEEVIVVDDASQQDEAYKVVIQKHQPQLPKLKLHTLAQNSGAPAARNAGINLAKSDWIALVDDDDEWLPAKLEKQAQLIEHSSKRTGLVYSWCEAVGTNGMESYTSKPTSKGDLRGPLLRNNFILSPTVIASRKALEAVQGFDESLTSCQDWDTWTKIALAGYHADLVPETLALYHRHGGESVGLSSNARSGYKRFLQKHYWAIIRHTGPLNWAKKALLYLSAARS